jgi:hypothetical protein
VRRDFLSSQIDDLGVQLRILKVTLPGTRDSLNVARFTAFADTVKRIEQIAHNLATAAGLNGVHVPQTPDLDQPTEEDEG